ncbi:MAG: methyltransferase domain-containing protein [Gammaproteobacteria bacterium]|nr:methyltransferase domain-containing protein [Gammaproteobacteria bacterium]
MNMQSAVLSTYSDGAKEVQAELCCPVDYDTSLLKMLPQEIIEKDYGCGDPSRYVREGDTVVDLGSGGGKICYMAAHLAGENGEIIGVDMNDDMLGLARKYQSEMAKKIGGDRVRFVKGHIQDLALDLEALDKYLTANPVNNADAYHDLIAWKSKQRNEAPLIADNSVDLVISNCVLNLVSDAEKIQLINEIFRVLKPGGRVAISDIVSDEYVPDHLKADPKLWSGCISGAFQEQEFADAFIDAGFVGACYDKWDTAPWQTVEGIEFRSVTLTASKPLVSNDDTVHEVIYQGPFAEICDDYGNIFVRGEKTPVDAESCAALFSGAYQNLFTDCNVPLGYSAESSGCCAPAANEKSSCC